MDPVREKRVKKPTKHYDPAKEAAKPQWGEVKKKKTKKPEDKKPETKKPVHTYFISSDEEPEQEPPMAGSSAGGAAAGPVHTTYFSDSD